ncbi:MAG: squalene--hopene cyclase [Verrucomicrobiaceae bacterium]|nr:squalene--hopene cyclase [Verrucomicrobiaceae bacterium]
MTSSPLHETLANARRVLLAERNAAGHWEGELSTSALSTATSIVALGTVDPATHRAVVARACEWLVAHHNPDGGWGDTTKSFSNISTTLLCWSALTRFGNGDGRSAAAVKAAEGWIREYVGSLDPRLIAETVKARYGKDRTFSVPILMLCAICGTLGPAGWRLVLPLPFHLAVFPRTWFAALRLPVVSYALPALIAIGYARYRKGGGTRKRLRKPPLFWPRLSELLTSIQPASGGFLEAAPLTGFVTMALVAAGETGHPVVEKSVAFLLRTVREDGSWPIDTNLATWATTLAVKALAQEGRVAHPTLFDGQEKILNWLLRQQYRDVHPFTNSAPGGWAWTDLSGGVPDADDTPGALLALAALDPARERADVLAAAAAGVRWLLDLQNRDGGIPTFCRGWGALPFDRSSPDLTAHTLRAWHVWRPDLPAALQERIDLAAERARRFLEKKRRPDGSWSPLWFGNQHRLVDEENPSYGTAKVVLAFLQAGRDDLAAPGLAWLRSQQNADGGWGALRDRTPSTIEETALAMSALAGAPDDGAATDTALARGERWLCEATKNGTVFEPSPIGFYFARLWYFEKAYPVVWTVEALSRLARRRAM